MTTIHTVILVAHTVIATLIIVLVLLQRGKGAEAGAAFGSGASGTVFGARGTSNFFSRATGILATAFFISSLTLAYLSSQTTQVSSIMDEAPTATETVDEVAAPANSGELPALPDAEQVDQALQPDELPALDAPDEESTPKE
jgi:preprotein translocase subunit SecG